MGETTDAIDRLRSFYERGWKYPLPVLALPPAAYDEWLRLPEPRPFERFQVVCAMPVPRWANPTA